MPHYPDDLYTVSAGITPNNYWNPYVTKHDTSSFYNWEQDNLPLYDLEERTEYLWGKAGYGTSTIPGMALLVSGTNETGNGRVFTDLQTAINIVPRDLRFPVCIEVVASGALGSIDLDGITCSEKGMLEIVNRGCIKAYSDKFAGVASGQGAVAISHDAAVLGSDALIWRSVSSIDLSSTTSQVWSRVQENLGVAEAACKASARRMFHHPTLPVSNDDFVGSGKDMRAFFNTAHTNLAGHRSAKVQFSLHEPSGTHVAPNPWSKVTANVIDVNEYSRAGYSNAVYKNTVRDNSVKELDVSAKNQQDDSALKRAIPGTSFSLNNYDQAAGLMYANHVSSIRVNNCDGPVYIRGFCVDGANTGGGENGTPVGKYLTETGALVEGSNGVVLENLATTRCTKYGTEIRNSDVTVSRGFYSIRNYEVTDNTLDSAIRAKVDTAGLRAFNSTVSVSADPLYASGVDFLFYTQYNNTGILLENSVLNSATSGVNQNTHIHTGYNNYGLKAVNSQVDIDGRLDSYNNEYGVDVTNSLVKLDLATIENNEYIGLRGKGSTVIYNKSHSAQGTSNLLNELRQSQTLFRQNGQHLVLDANSEFTYPNSTNGLIVNHDIPKHHGHMRMVKSHGVADRGAKNTSIPAVEINNSRADLIHCRLDVSGMLGAHPTKGSALLAANNSEVNFLGTGSGTTMVIGPPDLAKQLHNAGIASDNNSKVSFRGPTVVAQFGIDVLADNNSVVEFSPHKTRSGELDTSGFMLHHPHNHTIVELHSTRACLVANNNSTINMENLGDYHALWDVSAYPAGGNSNFGAGTDTANFDLSALCYRGGMQFFPNPADAITNSIDSGSRQNIASALTDNAAGDRIKNARSPLGGVDTLYQILDPFHADSSAINKISVSLGGYCVRALGGSQVNVKNVHFPCGGPIANGTYFDPTKSEAYTGKTGNNNLLIWNIADSSRLNASYLSVSGTHPDKSSYHGPRAAYFSGESYNEFASGTITDNTSTSAVAYGAEHNSETGRIAVCDLYGLGVQVSDVDGLRWADGGPTFSVLSAISESVHNNSTTIGMTGYQNKGPFRLYFSVDPAMKQVGYASGNLNGAVPVGGVYPYHINDNRPYQHLAQGYSLSGPAGVPVGAGMGLDNVSAVGYQHLLLSSTNAPLSPQYKGMPDLGLSGYYRSKDFGPQHNPYNIMLDESAANTFANAKNAAFRAVGDRGGPKAVIYSSHDASGGELETPTATQLGVGFRSSNIFDLGKGN